MNIQPHGGMNPFLQHGVGMGQQATDESGVMASQQMNQIKQTSAMQMKFQTEMGLIQMMVKMNEALAKMFKALGEAIKNLA
jgi:hypothetical protein